MARSFESELTDLQEQGLLRRVRTFDSPQAILMKCDGREIINFSSNDYLGLADSDLLKTAAKTALDEFGSGSGSSRLVCGTLAPHAQLEAALARFKNTRAALSFSSGYAAAVGTLSALCHEGDVIILDKLCHASLIDGARLSGAFIRVFPHLHYDKLESHLKWARKSYPDARIVVATESVFSMDGDCSPLVPIVELKNRFDALLLLDEAHAIGVLGKNGRGLAFDQGVEKDVDIHMGTLSKALGAAGGYICGSQALVDFLINRARSFIYSTAPSPVVAAAAKAAVEFLQTSEGEQRRQLLWQNIQLMERELPRSIQDRTKYSSAILPLILGSSQRALAIADALLDEGFLVPAIRYPTVARDSARLRITLTATHSRDQISALCKTLNAIYAKL